MLTLPGELRWDPAEGEWEARCYLHPDPCAALWSLPPWVGEDPEAAALYLTDRGWACYEGRWVCPRHNDPRNVPGPQHGRCEQCDAPVVRDLLDAAGMCPLCAPRAAP